jgi:hypothetical protein
MTITSFPVVASAALVAGVVWFAHGLASLRRKRLIENTPSAKIRSMAMGLVEINGAVATRSALASPFSGKPCVFWEVEIAVPKGRNEGWHTVHRNQSGQPFFVEDGTGTALVYPHGAECKLGYGNEEVCNGFALPECYSSYIKQHGTGLGLMWRVEQLRFRERLLEETQHVYIVGTAMPISRAVNLAGDDDLQATGTEGAQGATAAGGGVAHHQAPVATIRQGENEKTFIISQQSELMVTFELGLKAFAGMIGGPIAFLIGLSFWMDQLTKWRK